MPAGDQMRRLPAHAGRLRPWERFTIALVLLAMAALILVVVLSAGPPPHPARGRAVTGAGGGSTASAGPGGVLPALASGEDQRLAAALTRVLRHRGGSLAVGVMAGQTGAVYDGDRLFRAAGIAGADILAALLLQHQRARTPLSGQQRKLAGRMIENGDGAAAAALWGAVGQAKGLRAANRLLHLGRTTPACAWPLTSTTVGDQLRLLADLTAARSPLSAASRSYELGLMRHVIAAQQWGVTAAAALGTWPAVANGWLPGGAARWEVNSIGVISRAGRQVLVAVLSGGQPTESAGIAEVEAAVKAAVSATIGA